MASDDDVGRVRDDADLGVCGGGGMGDANDGDGECVREEEREPVRLTPRET